MFTYHRTVNAERVKLIQNADESRNKTTKQFSYSKLSIVPFLLCLFLSEGIVSFVVNEWTQSFVHHQYFENDTVTMNSSECENKNSSDPIYIKYKETQQTASKWMNYYKLAEYLPTIVTTFILPSYTDTFGRRFLFVFGSLAFLIKCSIVTITIRYYKSLLYIVLAHFIEGISGTSFALFSVSFSYIADFTKPGKKRVLGIVGIEGVFMIAAVAAGFLSGYLVETIQLGFFITMVICLGLAFIAFMLAVFSLPESLPEDRRTHRKTFFNMLQRVTDFYVSKDFKGLRMCFLVLLLSFAFAGITDVNRSALETLFLLGQPFCWDPSRIGNFQLVRQALRGVAGLIILHLLQKLMSNEVIAMISTISNTASFIMEGYADSELKIYLVAVIGIVSFLVIPMVRALMSGITPADKQGSMFASVAVIQVISALTSALTQNTVYSATVSIMNGFVFLVMAGLSMIDFILLLLFCFIKPYNISEHQNRVHPSSSNVFDKPTTKSWS